MLIPLGKQSGPTDIVDLLLECHGRIRSFTDLARRLGESSGLPDPQVADAAHSIRRYFTVALPLHLQDEEESVLPRLQGHAPEIDAALELMREEHEAHGEALGRVVGLCARLEETPADHTGLRNELTDAAIALEATFRAHLEREEAVLFPAMRRLLPAEVLAEMMGELRGRRAPAA